MVNAAENARRTLFLAGWHLRLRWLRIRRERTMLVAALAIFLLVGVRVLPRMFALARRIHGGLSHWSPEEQAMARASFAAIVWLLCVAAPTGRIVEPAAMRRYPFDSAQRLRARLLAEAVDYEWLFVFLAFGFAIPLLVGLIAGVHGVLGVTFTAAGLVAMWLGAIALRAGAMASVRLGRSRIRSVLLALVPLVWILSLTAILARHAFAVWKRTADPSTSLPPLWPPVWWARCVDAWVAGDFAAASFWLGAVIAALIGSFAVAEFLHARSQEVLGDPAPRSFVPHRSRIAEGVPPGPVAATFAKEWLALRRDSLLRSAYAGAIVLPLLALGWIALGRESIVEWRAKAFWFLGIATAFALGTAKGSSLALERHGAAILRQLPVRHLRLGFGMDLVQWIVTASAVTLVLATTGFILGPTLDLLVVWGTALALSWGFLAVQHAVARFFPFHVDRSSGWFEVPLVAGVLTLCLGSLVIVPVFIAHNSLGDAGGFAAALVVSPIAYWLGGQILERDSPP